MRARGVGRLRLQRRHARVGHHVHARRQARVGIADGGQPALRDEGADAEVAVGQIFRVGDGPRPAVHRHGRLCGLKAVLGMRVAAGRIAHHLERELDGQRSAGGVARRPRQADADQAARQQQRVRGRIAVRPGAGSCGRRRQRTTDLSRRSLPSARGRSRPPRPWRRRADGRSRRLGRSSRAARKTGGRGCRRCRTC